MIGFIIIVVVGISFFVVAKNPVDQCKHWYQDIHEDRRHVHKPHIFV
jgi:hypothetical protein